MIMGSVVSLLPGSRLEGYLLSWVGTEGKGFSFVQSMKCARRELGVMGTDRKRVEANEKVHKMVTS
jgi:hypothetical protein